MLVKKKYSFELLKNTSSKAYLISIISIALISILGIFIEKLTGYRVVALILLLNVSILAMFLHIVPVLFASLISALVWDYFFIPPRNTFQIGSTEDFLMLLMYFIIALINAVLTNKIRLMDKLANQKEERENTIRLYNTLLNSLSHELRTPIATILGASDTLQHNAARLTDENKRQLINEISTASLRLNLQVENLLNMSRLESGFIKPKLDWCDINELIYSVVNKFIPELKEHEIIIDIPDELPLFKIDYGLLQQILFNLINNALQHTPTESIIIVKIDYTQQRLNIIISDSGNGFPPNEMDKVFEKFYRLKTAPTGGTGLGLSIVKGFVQALNGSIDLKNNKSGGAEFTLSFKTEVSFLNTVKNE